MAAWTPFSGAFRWKPWTRAHAAARGDRPDHLDRCAADAVQLVHHVADDAAVVRHDVDDVAHLRALGAGGEVALGFRLKLDL